MISVELSKPGSCTGRAAAARDGPLLSSHCSFYNERVQKFLHTAHAVLWAEYRQARREWKCEVTKFGQDVLRRHKTFNAARTRWRREMIQDEGSEHSECSRSLSLSGPFSTYANHRSPSEYKRPESAMWSRGCDVQQETGPLTVCLVLHYLMRLHLQNIFSYAR